MGVGAEVPAPFVVGVSRSGTTLLRLMLDSHPQLAIPAETRFLPELFEVVAAGADRTETARFITRHPRWGDFPIDGHELTRAIASLDRLTGGAAARVFYRLYASGQGKPRWGDKSPPYVTAIRVIHRQLPEARFVHLIRDGRDVAASLLARPWGRPTPTQIARRWRREVRAGRRQGARVGPGLYLELRYEELVSDPEGALRRVCSHVGLDFVPGMLHYHERSGQRLAEVGDLPVAGRELSAEQRATQFERVHGPVTQARIGSWRQELGARDRAEFEAAAGPLLEELGYPTQ